MKRGNKESAQPGVSGQTKPGRAQYKADINHSTEKTIPSTSWGANSKKICVKLSPGQFLADANFTLPWRAIIVADTGTGKTTYAIENLEGQTLVVTSSTISLRQLKEKYPDADVYYQDEKTARPDSELILTTYESFKYVLKIIDASRFNLVIDEAHNFGASGDKNFRGRALEEVLDTIGAAWKRVILMTGTPIPWSHPELTNFTTIEVSRPLRDQQAQRVIWRKKIRKPNGKIATIGRKIDALLRLCTLEKSHLVFLNSKGRVLENVIAGLLANGFSNDQIAWLNRDNKFSSQVGQSIIEAERLPDGVKVLIVTAVFIEAVNLQDRFDCMHLYSHVHPALAQQLVSRLRTDAAGIVYRYNAERGTADSVNEARTQAVYLKLAQDTLADIKNTMPDPGDDSLEAFTARRCVKAFARERQYLVRVDYDEETNERLYTISYVGVDRETFKTIEEFTHEHPKVYKFMTVRYGWSWQPDLDLCVTADPEEERERKETAEEMAARREEAFRQRVETVRQGGEDWAQQERQRGGLDTLTLQAISHVLRIQDAIIGDSQENGPWSGPSTAERETAFDMACDLVLETGESTRAVNRLVRRFRIQHMRGECQFTDALYSAFNEDDMLTSADIQRKIKKLFTSDPVMRTFAIERYLLPWKIKIESPITARRAVELLGDLFTLKRIKTATRNGRANAYRLVNSDPGGCLTKLEIFTNNITRKVRQKPIPIYL